ncbi:class I SAM-dependent methyltransferase [Pseudoflavitalea rhizosphaerae]|uniref:class I SAM-dependent methyltransferase n=1 Tax=Pseudoflavitalea rhizosphaerae TaxID=1884793 RepID=UPI000F8CBFEF|nr:class I SAM-dependent methyltransferase [Pseudoflavitalea rhizosphaerae]
MLSFTPVKPNWFKDWFNSPYYHQLYFQRDHTEAAQFINRLLDFLQPAAHARMLDAACGRGRHSLQLAGKGYDVTGTDLAAESIEAASRHELKNLHFFRHDMRDPFRLNYFDYVFNFFTSFGYFNTDIEHNNSICSFAQSLRPGGALVMDYLNVQYAESQLVHQQEIELGNVNYFITRWFDESHFYKKIEVHDPAQQEPLIFGEKVARFTLEHFRGMFASHQLEIVQVFGDYHLNQYDQQNSPRLIMVAKKQ